MFDFSNMLGKLISLLGLKLNRTVGAYIGVSEMEKQQLLLSYF